MKSKLFEELNARYEAKKFDRLCELILVTVGMLILLMIATTLADTNKMLKVLTCNALNDTPDSFSHCLDNE